jgi:hypothetical protein
MGYREAIVTKVGTKILRVRKDDSWAAGIITVIDLVRWVTIKFWSKREEGRRSLFIDTKSRT